MPRRVRELHQYTRYWRRFLKRRRALWHWLLMSNLSKPSSETFLIITMCFLNKTLSSISSNTNLFPLSKFVVLVTLRMRSYLTIVVQNQMKFDVWTFHTQWFIRMEWYFLLKNVHNYIALICINSFNLFSHYARFLARSIVVISMVSSVSRVAASRNSPFTIMRRFESHQYFHFIFYCIIFSYVSFIPFWTTVLTFIQSVP